MRLLSIAAIWAAALLALAAAKIPEKGKYPEAQSDAEFGEVVLDALMENKKLGANIRGDYGSSQIRWYGCITCMERMRNYRHVVRGGGVEEAMWACAAKHHPGLKPRFATQFCNPVHEHRYLGMFDGKFVDEFYGTKSFAYDRYVLELMFKMGPDGQKRVQQINDAVKGALLTRDGDAGNESEFMYEFKKEL